ncbi:MAG: lipid-A-disaccharide synthase-related protein [Cyanobium sp.]
MPSHQPPPLLVLSNGHGEDVIALALIEALKRRSPSVPVSVLPLVGSGEAFAAAEGRGLLQRVGPRGTLPSGGFSNQSLRGLFEDLMAGLPLLSWRQWRLVRTWGASGRPMLAVGDLLPLLLAWGSGGPFAFLGTPKSDYTWASPPPAGWGTSPLADRYHRCKGSEWDPWEWSLMGSRRCRLVAMRDALTARGLRRHGVAAVALGNPMMDGLGGAPLPAGLRQHRRVLLLPGSRMPEALTNLRRLLAALPTAPETDPMGAPWLVLLATGRQPGSAALATTLSAAGFQPMETPAAAIPSEREATPESLWRRGPIQLWVGAGRFRHWAGWAEVGLATAGTATEQLVGLGVPALSLPGPGPQFQAGFARRQSRLLGGAVRPLASPASLGRALHALLDNDEERLRLGRAGRRRMGGAGGSDRLAEQIDRCLLQRG